LPPPQNRAIHYLVLPLAWWSYILIADNLLLKLRVDRFYATDGASFDHAPISVFIWLLFEAYNFVTGIGHTIVLADMAALPDMPSHSQPSAGIFITSDLAELILGRFPRAGIGMRKLASRLLPPSVFFIVLGLI
jgi:hypothetical protein